MGRISASVELSRERSLQIRFLYYIATCVVISIHCAIETPVHGVVQNVFIMYGTKWAVPFFFLMSGMFFHITHVNDFEGFKKAVVKKFWSLVVPYLLWCVIGFLLRVPLLLAEIKLSSLALLLDAIFGISSQFPIGNGVLWFLRSLIVFQYGLMLILGCISRDQRLRFISFLLLSILLGGGLLIHGMSVWLYTFVGTPSSPFYFFIGYIFSRRIILFKGFKNCLANVAFCILLVGVAVLCAFLGFGTISRHIANLTTMLIFWVFMPTFETRGRFECVCLHTFFMYCVHRVPVEYLNKFFVYCGFNHILPADIYYFIFTMISILLLTVASILLSQKMTKVYKVLSGSRL